MAQQSWDTIHLQPLRLRQDIRLPLRQEEHTASSSRVKKFMENVLLKRFPVQLLDSLKHTTLPTLRQAYTARTPMSHNQAQHSTSRTSTRIVTRTHCPAWQQLDSYEQPMERFCFWLTQNVLLKKFPVQYSWKDTQRLTSRKKKKQRYSVRLRNTYSFT